MEISRVPTFTAAVIINLTLGQNVLENTTAIVLEYVRG